jgi:hypothetical protein
MIDGAPRLMVTIHSCPPTGELPITWDGKPPIWMAWTGDNPLPDLLALFLESVRRHNGADFEVIVVTPENVRQCLEPHPAYQYLSLNHRADYLRLHLLHRYGGVYLDMDTIALRSLAGLYQDLASFDIVTYDGATWGEVFGSSVFGPTRRGSVLTTAWTEEIDRRLDANHDALAAHRRESDDLHKDSLGWSALMSELVTPIAWRLVNAGQLSVRLLDPVWAHFAPGQPGSSDVMRECSPVVPDTELLILNYTTFADPIRRLSRAEILGSEIGLCRLIQHAVGYERSLRVRDAGTR